MAVSTPEPSHDGYHLILEPSSKRLRVELGGVTIAESDRVVAMHETRLAPVYYFPSQDVRTDLLEKTNKLTHCPFKGNASYWSLEFGEKVA